MTSKKTSKGRKSGLGKSWESGGKKFPYVGRGGRRVLTRKQKEEMERQKTVQEKGKVCGKKR